MPALATWAPEDGVLGAVAPLALAIAQPTALVIDLAVGGLPLPAARTLRQLVDGGLRAPDLGPARRGVAVLGNGGVEAEEAAEVVGHLLRGWPSVVIRTARPDPLDAALPTVPVRLLVPAGWVPPRERAVYQPLMPVPRRRPSGSIVLPPARRATIGSLLAGVVPRRDRWLRAWRAVWEMSW